MAWLNYHHLYYFWVTATEGSISSASKKLRIGQPTISTQIKNLEESMSQVLFKRKSRGLHLTEAGKVVLDYANQIFNLGNELMEVVKDETFSRRTHIQIGALDSVPKTLVQSLIHSAQKIAPCVITVIEGGGDYLFRELQAHRIDIVVSNFPPTIGSSKEYFSRLLAKIPITVFSTKKYQPLKRKFPNSLQDQPFIMPTLHSKLRHDLNHYFQTRQIKIDVVIETQDTSIQKLLGNEGMGLVPLPDIAGKELIKEGKLIKLGRLQGVTEDFWLVSSPRKFSNPIAETLMKNFKWQA
ncbi:MAG: LysR family transcriptional regulator [Nitrospinaceae bacterium]|nr:LysR family transcriptional regulator [Nitrospina sp.]MBT5868967.1 LysR family transcriptional regulator [Nitrospinaceae bacterium]MBT6347479.1 LysR family transcriptional regulator [Nitrospina sp.]